MEFDKLEDQITLQYMKHNRQNRTLQNNNNKIMLNKESQLARGKPFGYIQVQLRSLYTSAAEKLNQGLPGTPI